MSEKRTYRKYTKEFKEEAARLVLDRGLSRAAVARDLGRSRFLDMTTRARGK